MYCSYCIIMKDSRAVTIIWHTVRHMTHRLAPDWTNLWALTRNSKDIWVCFTTCRYNTTINVPLWLALPGQTLAADWSVGEKFLWARKQQEECSGGHRMAQIEIWCVGWTRHALFKVTQKWLCSRHFVSMFWRLHTIEHTHWQWTRQTS